MTVASFGVITQSNVCVFMKVNESDLQHFFSQHGAVKEVKIVIDRSGMSKG